MQISGKNGIVPPCYFIMTEQSTGHVEVKHTAFSMHIVNILFATALTTNNAYYTIMQCIKHLKKEMEKTLFNEHTSKSLSNWKNMR